MKSFKHLHHRICDRDNIQLAIRKASKGKAHKRHVSRVLSNLSLSIDYVKSLLEKPDDLHIEVAHHTRLESGKKRIIETTHFYPYHIMYHSVMNIVEPILSKSFHSHSFSHRVNKGTDAGIRLAKRYVREYKYYLKFDLKKYYENINLNTLVNLISKKIKCDKTITLIKRFLLMDTGRTIGLQLGNYPSGIFANYYLTHLDHCFDKSVKFIRYADDIVLFGNNKDDLWRNFNKYNRGLKELKLVAHKVNLSLTSNNGLDFLGVRMFPTHTLVRTRVARRIKRFKNIKRVTTKAFRRVFSLYSFVYKANAWGLFTNSIRPIALKLRAYAKAHKIKFPLKYKTLYRRGKTQPRVNSQ